MVQSIKCQINIICIKNYTKDFKQSPPNKSRCVPFGNTQIGLRNGCGTREAIGVMRTICERRLGHDNEIFIFFVDLKNAFDRIT